MTDIKTDQWPAEAIELQTCSLKVKNFKCFTEIAGVAQGCDEIKPINIIIGKNNSGKTAFLEAILSAFVAKHSSSANQFNCELVLERTVTNEAISRLTNVREDVKIADQSENFAPSDYARHLTGKKIQFRLRGDEIVFTSDTKSDDPFHNEKVRRIGTSLTTWANRPFKNRFVRSITSDRNIIPESKRGDGKIVLDSNGSGLTSFLQSLMCRANDNRLDLIENELVPALNEILLPENRYERILIREEDGLWELYLEEKLKGVIPLSATGSGLKTVLLVLANLLVLPGLQERSDRHRYVFAFEELENNLHPATLRRLFLYIHRYSLVHRCHFFITTHSHIVIDLFSGNDDAQILSVSHNGQYTTVRTLKTRYDGMNVLNDLDVRASDLLQTNVVIWVEGPTDAMYLERWIDLHSNGTLRRGIDYQCVNYGGSVVTHLTFDVEIADKLIEATKICRHAIFIVDSNRSAERSQLCDQAVRVSKEVEKAGGYGWITDGREIENYLPASVLPCESDATGAKYRDIYELIKQARGNKTEMRKISLANQVIPNLSIENMYCHDLKVQLTKVCDLLELWNRKTAH